jgi:DNA polymerase-4
MSRALRLCPQLISVRHHFQDYIEMSAKVMELAQAYSPIVQPISIDEAFIDVSDLPGEPLEHAQLLQSEIRKRLHLPCSLGVATNKLVAKVATDVGKAAAHREGRYPNSIQVVPPGEEAAFLAPLPCEALWGIGPKTADRLAEKGIYTIGDIARYPVKLLEVKFGQIGADLHRRAMGLDDSAVHISHGTKSVSQEHTFSRDISDGKQLRQMVSDQSESIARRLKKLELFGSTVKIKLRWPDFTTITRQSTLPQPSDSGRQIAKAALELLKQHWKPGKAVRLLGVGVTNLGPRKQQLSLWDWDAKNAERQQRLEDAIHALQKEYGENAIRKGAKVQH